jgi:hypothetical protein
MADAGTPDWWLDRLYKRLNERRPLIQEWDKWYTGEHPAPEGYEGAEALFQRVLDAVGLNMLAVVSDAPMPRMKISGFKVNGKVNDDIWDIWQANNFDRGSKLVRQDKHALSEAYVLVDPNGGDVRLTPEHPEQCIVEYAPGSSRDRAAGLKVWLDDIGETPRSTRLSTCRGDLPLRGSDARVHAAPHDAGPAPELGVAGRVWPESARRGAVGAVPEPWPDDERPAAGVPRRDPPAEAHQQDAARPDGDAGPGRVQGDVGDRLQIPRDPPPESRSRTSSRPINRMFINENPDGKFGQLQAEDIKQMLDAVRDDVVDCAVLVPTSADSILGKLVNVAADGLKLAQSSEVSRTRDRMGEEDDSWEDVVRLGLKGAGKSVPNVSRMTTEWRNPEYVTDTEQANAATVAIGAGMPREVAWERYFNASPDDVKDWARRLGPNSLTRSWRSTR